MSRVTGTTLVGVDGAAIEVEVRISSQLPKVDIVGLPEAAVRESKARVRAAISAAGGRFPDRRVTISLAPAELRKSGAALDLPIAVGILAEAGDVSSERLQDVAFFGELALDGRLRPVRGALALTLASRNAGCKSVIVATDNAREAALAPGIDVYGARHLEEVCRHLSGSELLARAESQVAIPTPRPALDLSDVRGQASAKRALEIAAAGGHALLLLGPPGAGKTMLASRLPGVLPPLSFEEALEATRIRGAAVGPNENAPAIVSERPFRAPHHTASTAGLMGGGSPPQPGEITLAHRGVLFLDEVLEFNRKTLEGLRQVLESHQIRIARAGYSCCFPAQFMLVAASNPCPCGWYRSERRDCRCDPRAIERYLERLSGPLLDRIDLHATLPALRWRDLEPSTPAESSAAVQSRVVAAREQQLRRGHTANAEIPDARLDEVVAASPDARKLLGRAVDRLGLSARAARRTLRVARSIADLAESDGLGSNHMAEALHFREAAHR